MNLFELAIRNNELAKFAKGDGEYFIQDRSGWDGHWVYSAWTNHIFPFLKEMDEHDVEKHVVQLFKSILEIDDLEAGPKLHVLINHLHSYFYILHKVKGEDRLGPLVGELEQRLADLLVLEKESDEEAYQLSVKAIERIQSRGGLPNLRIT